jgi:hypothetical protein
MVSTRAKLSVIFTCLILEAQGFEDPGLAPVDAWGSMWARLYGPPNIDGSWRGPPPPPTQLSPLGYDEVPFTEAMVLQQHAGLMEGLHKPNLSFESPCWWSQTDGARKLECLPHGFILGFPK